MISSCIAKICLKIEELREKKLNLFQVTFCAKNCHVQKKKFNFRRIVYKCMDDNRPIP